MKNILAFLVAAAWLFASCHSSTPSEKISAYPVTSVIERIDPALDSILLTSAKVEIIADSLDWSEGPVWVSAGNMLLFSDVPRNIIYKWTEKNGKEVFLTPSGYTASLKRGGEMGSNGLAIDKDHHLVICQHGNRQLAKMDASLDKPAPVFSTIAKVYDGKRFNSPNDVVIDDAGDVYFTDPPYGLEKQLADPGKELSFQGVFKVKKDGRVILLTDTLTRPNGIAFMPGGKELLIANSDVAKPIWYVFDVDGDSLSHARIFYNASGFDSTEKGLPDGMKIDRQGNVFAAGPGGVWIFRKDGKLLGKIKLTTAASNCAFSPDEKTLYITNDHFVLRVKLR